MTVRGTKRLVLMAAALVVVAAALNIWNAFGPRGQGWKDFTDILPFGFFAILLATLWTQLSKQEAEHGPDYTPPASPHARTLLVIAGLLPVILTAVAVFLIVRKG